MSVLVIAIGWGVTQGATAPLPAWVFDGRTGVHTPEGSWSPARQAYAPRSTLPARTCAQISAFGSA